MALFAARMNDPQLCDLHGAAPLPDGALNVRINSQPTVRAGDAFKCGGCPNRVQTGASTVTFGGELAARATDRSDHGGRIVMGSTNVVIGGPMGMGCIGAGKSTCQAMAAGRKSGQTNQSYGNCVLESVRQLIRRGKENEVTEDEMLNHGLRRGATSNPGHDDHGAANGDIGATIMEDFGVPAERMPAQAPATLATLKQAITERRGVIAFVDAKDLWPDEKDSGCHAVVVTGVELDKDGNVTAVFINDTGRGDCGRKVPAAEFGAGMRNLPTERDKGGAQLLVTKGPIW
jgi:uncharacterized Zn-binding protein involved in type VI secretion